MAPPAVRIGETIIAPGEGRVVAFRLPRRAAETSLADAVPVFALVGRVAGPRVVILAAPRGFETRAAGLAVGLTRTLSADTLRGSIVIVPVLRPGGRFAPGGRPVKRSLEWHLPGDPSGRQPARDAATIFSELIADASLILVLSQPDPGRAGILTLRGDLDDPRVRRLAEGASLPVLVHAAPAGPVRRQGPVRLELCLATNPASASDTITAIERLLQPGPSAETPRRAPTTRLASIRRVTPVLAPVGGLLHTSAQPGDMVAKGTTLACVTPPLAPNARAILAPHDGLVLEAPSRDGARRGAKLFELGRLRGAGVRQRIVPRQSPAAGAPPGEVSPAGLRPASLARPTVPAASPPNHGRALRLGWVERVSLPSLGVTALLAKIDTGARTSALHVARMKIVGSGGLPRRPILEITIPGQITVARPDGKAARPARVVRVQVREWARVKDTSGRTERRPVIETTLHIGPLERRIRLTLTDRGDMLYPMLVGRTALGNGVVVDPSQRRVLREAGGPAKVPRGRRKQEQA